jgi:Tol biopolymer transport system component/DNA-binding winged helix-turn-helix (wHTH) protein
VLQPTRSFRIIRFGLFEADFATRELRREGARVKLQDRPFEILTILVEHPNEVITREDFRQKLWAADTFVDFDHSLNTSINRLRQALRDNAENPAFIATVGRVGYRFIAPVTVICNGSAPSTTANSPLLETAAVPVASPAPAHSTFKTWRVAVVLGTAALLAAVVFAAHRLFPQSPVRVLDISQISHNTRLDPWGRLTTDGARLLFLERAGDHWNLMQVPASGGEAEPFSDVYRNMRVVNISPDRSQFLAFTFAARIPDLPLWLVPVVGGPPRRVGNVVADDAVFTPDGAKITFNAADGIYLCERNGSDVEKLVSLPGRSAHPAWSKDGRRLRFTLYDDTSGGSTIWEVTADGKNPHPVFRSWAQAGHERCGRWSADGRYFFFESTQAGLQTVWVVRDSEDSWLPEIRQPVQLTFGPNGYGTPVPDAAGRSVYVWGGQEHREVVRYDAAHQTFQPMLPNLKFGYFAYSPDGSQLAYEYAGAMWRSRSDGSEPYPILQDYAGLHHIGWSPDGKQILFGGGRRGESASHFFAMPAEGGVPRQIHLASGASEPVWSADGLSIIFFRWLSTGVTPPEQSGVYKMDLQTSQTTRIPGSENLVHVLPSPDGRFLAAVSEPRSGQLSRLKIFDFATERWMEVARGTLLSGHAWSHDSRFFYYQDLLSPEEPIFRYDLSTAKTERVMDFAALLHAGVMRCGFIGFAPDESILAVTTRGEGDIYRIDLDLP